MDQIVKFQEFRDVAGPFNIYYSGSSNPNEVLVKASASFDDLYFGYPLSYVDTPISIRVVSIDSYITQSSAYYYFPTTTTTTSTTTSTTTVTPTTTTSTTTVAPTTTSTTTSTTTGAGPTTTTTTEAPTTTTTSTTTSTTTGAGPTTTTTTAAPTTTTTSTTTSTTTAAPTTTTTTTTSTTTSTTTAQPQFTVYGGADQTEACNSSTPIQVYSSTNSIGIGATITIVPSTPYNYDYLAYSGTVYGMAGSSINDTGNSCSPYVTTTSTTTTSTTQPPQNTYNFNVASGTSGPTGAGTACAEAGSFNWTDTLYTGVAPGTGLVNLVTYYQSDGVTVFNGGGNTYSDGTVYGTIAGNGVFTYVGNCNIS